VGAHGNYVVIHDELSDQTYSLFNNVNKSRLFSLLKNCCTDCYP
jgi:hypothetical protein